MRWWETSVGGDMRGRIIGLVRRGHQTVEELAAALGVTDNAVRAHLQTLERSGLISAVDVRRTGAAGKPSTVYAVARDAEPMLSSAYAPVLAALVAALDERMTDRQLDALFRDVGRRLAEDVNVEGSSGQSLEHRVRAASEVLHALGGELDVERVGGSNSFAIRGHACPLSAAVRAKPATCHAIEELVAGVTGGDVHEQCDRSGAIPKCCFEVRRRSA